MLETLDLTEQQKRFHEIPLPNGKKDSIGVVDHRTIKGIRQVLFFRGDETYPVPPFYPLKERKRDRRPSINIGNTKPDMVQNFTDAVVEVAFDDQKLIQVIHAISREKLIPCSRKALHDADAFSHRPENDNWWNPTPEIFRGFIVFLNELAERLQNHRDILISHSCFEDIDQVIGQIQLIKEIILKTTVVNEEDGSSVLSLPDDLKRMFPEEKHTFKTLENNLPKAKAMYLNILGLDKHIQHFLAIACFIEYIFEAQRVDFTHRGVFPKLIPSNSGLELTFQDFSHAHEGTNETKKMDFFIDANTLCEEGLVVKEKPPVYVANNFTSRGYPSDIKDETSRQESQPAIYKWREGLKRKEVEKYLSDKGIEGDQKSRILESYDKHAFQPFKEIRLNTGRKVAVLTGANSRGKSTVLKALADQVHMTMMGRKVPSAYAEMSFCDRVFHDLEVKDDLKEGISTFRAQIRNVVTFLKEGTPDSLGLFDELYHGTGSSYLLALGWATLEAFAKRNLRAVVATHEELLTRIDKKNGYDSIAGFYHRPANDAEEILRNDIVNVSVGGHFELQEGAIADSDAFRIAEEEGLPEEIITRARQIFAHITEPKAA